MHRRLDILSPVYFKELKINIEGEYEIDLMGYQIKEVQDYVFHNAKNLQILNLSFNNIEKIGNDMFKCPDNCLSQLNELNLSHNNINQIKAYGFTGFNDEIIPSRLKKLSLSSNSIRQIEPFTFASINCLEELYLKNNLIESITADYFKELTRLKILDLSKNKIAVIEKDSFKELKELKEIKLQENQLEQLDTVLFSGLKNLEIIYLHFNKFKNNTENKLELYLENKIHKVTINANKEWVQNNLNLVRNTVNIIFKFKFF
jgi:Leucine-rich repeat (LRR) protein